MPSFYGILMNENKLRYLQNKCGDKIRRIEQRVYPDKLLGVMKKDDIFDIVRHTSLNGLYDLQTPSDIPGVNVITPVAMSILRTPLEERDLGILIDEKTVKFTRPSGRVDFYSDESLLDYFKEGRSMKDKLFGGEIVESPEVRISEKSKINISELFITDTKQTFEIFSKLVKKNVLVGCPHTTTGVEKFPINDDELGIYFFSTPDLFIEDREEEVKGDSYETVFGNISLRNGNGDGVKSSLDGDGHEFINVVDNGKTISQYDKKTGILHVHMDLPHTNSNFHSQEVIRLILHSFLDMFDKKLSEGFEKEIDVLKKEESKKIFRNIVLAKNDLLKSQLEDGLKQEREIIKKLASTMENNKNLRERIDYQKSDKELEEEVDREMNEIYNLHGVEKIVKIDQREMVLRTRPIFTKVQVEKKPSEEEWRKIGVIDIRIPLDSGSSITLKNHTHTHENKPHPHGYEDDRVCFGNISEGIVKLIAEKQYAVAISIIIEFLHQVNLKDTWGRYIYNWPLATQEEIDILDKGDVLLNPVEGVKPPSSRGTTTPGTEENRPSCSYCGSFDNICDTCGYCEDCCECAHCESCDSSVDWTCDNCNCCTNCCECYVCESCDNRIDTDNSFICSNCNYCEDCCECISCDNCGERFHTDYICDECGKCTEGCCECMTCDDCGAKRDEDDICPSCHKCDTRDYQHCDCATCNSCSKKTEDPCSTCDCCEDCCDCQTCSECNETTLLTESCSECGHCNDHCICEKEDEKIDSDTDEE